MHTQRTSVLQRDNDSKGKRRHDFGLITVGLIITSGRATAETCSPTQPCAIRVTIAGHNHPNITSSIPKTPEKPPENILMKHAPQNKLNTSQNTRLLTQ